MGTCKNCGRFIKQKGTGRRRQYCNKTCYKDYHKKNRLDTPKVRFNKKIRKLFIEHKLREGCSICGYRKSARALVYHHIKPQPYKKGQKRRQVDADAWYYEREDLKDCILLCANCHYELHEQMEREKCALKP